MSCPIAVASFTGLSVVGLQTLLTLMALIVFCVQGFPAYFWKIHFTKVENCERVKGLNLLFRNKNPRTFSGKPHTSCGRDD